ncbi:MAG: Hin recombinase [Acetatifactor sp.]|nr:Hin recombinase [Acetatifactor sp.]
MANNVRGAGRKPVLAEETLDEIRRRHEEGEPITALAQAYGISRQTLYNYLKEKDEGQRRIYRSLRQWQKLNRDFHGVDAADYMIRMDYMNGEECCSRLLVSFSKRQIVVENTTDVPFHRAFGMKAKPTWEDFEEFLEERCMPRTRDHLRLVLEDIGVDSYDPMAIIEKTGGRMAEDRQWLKISYFAPEQ